jgi:hypothetical protein
MKLSDLPYDPAWVPSGAIAAGRDWLIAKKPKFQYSANFAVVVETSGGEFVYESNINRACHRSIQSPEEPREGERRLVATEIGISRSSINKECLETWLKWFLYESFASPFILNKDDYEFCRDYGILLSANLPTPFLQSICITSRAPIDRHSAWLFEQFHDLSSRGYSKDLLFILMFTSSMGYDGEYFKCAYGNHRAFLLPSNEEALINFLTRDWGVNLKMDVEKDRFFHKHRNYTGVNSYPYGLEKKVGVQWIVDKVRDKLREYRKDKAPESKVKNPFAPVPVAPSEAGVSKEEFLAVVLPALQEEYGKYAQV